MIYRQADGLVGDLDARARLMDVARKGSALRAQAEQRHAIAKRKLEAEKRRAEVEAERQQRIAEQKAARVLRLESVYGRWWLADWWFSLIVASVPIVILLMTVPIWISVLSIDLSRLVVITSVPCMLPFIATYLYRRRAHRAIERERQWGQSIAGHWEMLGRKSVKRLMVIEFDGRAPDPGLTADVLAVVASKLDGDEAAALARTEVVDTTGNRMTLRGHELYHPRFYRYWSRALIDHALPLLTEVYAVAAVWVAADES